MVRRDDHVGLFEQPPVSQGLQQTAKLRIKRRDAIVIAVACHEQVTRRCLVLVDTDKIEEELVVALVHRCNAEGPRKISRGYIGLVGIEIV